MLRVWEKAWFSLCTVLLTGFLATAHAADPVTVEPVGDDLVVKIHGEEFTVLHHGPTLPKPYFWPVRGPGGAIITRPIDPNQKEHPHHKGIWLSVDEVNDIRFWAEKGQIQTRAVKSQSGNPATIELTNEWMGTDGTPALLEQTKVSIYPERLVIYDVKVTAPDGKTARFDDTKEGFFGIRIAESMREKEGGNVVNSNGKRRTQDCWGQHARWVDYTGTVDAKQYGVTLMDHPTNFRPSRYHVRDYGLFSMSPFGEGSYQNDPTKASPVILDDNKKSLRFRYGLYVHGGNSLEGNVAGAYELFLESTK